MTGHDSMRPTTAIPTKPTTTPVIPRISFPRRRLGDDLVAHDEEHRAGRRGKAPRQKRFGLRDHQRPSQRRERLDEAGQRRNDERRNPSIASVEVWDSGCNSSN